MISTRPVSEKKANDDALLLGELLEALSRMGVAGTVVLHRRLRLGGADIPPRAAFHPTELLVFGPTGSPRARVTVRERIVGAVYWVTPTDPHPEWRFPLNQLCEAAAYLRLLARYQPVPVP
ncbi:hypothetical protein [Sphaerisporangium sp. TRM90804]|uniref:hypothetical protein n=1 Tax=Sphaerisporangium sp. TRM90804 TaxID=3031113 RepID=UPI00244CCA3C|nr:hypothetical protein [Sphaerisporangium sp. TRM90804]MDH2424493.1 hypothetical protein [Sphaerisporangium sp. TRM90804]